MPLMERGFLYPYEVRRHLRLFNELLAGRRTLKEIAAELDDLADAAQGDIHSIILSDEDVCTQRDLSFLRGFSDRFDVQVAYSLRRQDIWLESWYFQNIKWQWQPAFAHATFSEFMAMLDHFHWIDYDRYLGHIEKLFGAGNTLPLVYEKSQMPNGPVAAFCDRIGLTDRDGFAEPEHMNASFPPEVSEFMRQLPIDAAQTGYRNVLMRVISHINGPIRAKSPVQSGLLLPHGDRVALLDRFAAGNARVARRHFARDTLFTDPLPAPDAPLASLRLPEDSATLIDDFIRPFLTAARKLDRETLIGPDHASDALITLMAPFTPDASRDHDLPGDAPTLMREHVVPMVGEMIRNAREKKILRSGFAPLREKTRTLQSLILPDAAVPDAPGLCFHPLPDQAGPQVETGTLHFEDGAGASFDTWFNLFDAAAWARLTNINHLQLTFSGKGRFRVAVYVDTEETDALCAIRQEISLGDGPVHVPTISPGKGPLRAWFTLTALGSATLQDARWCTANAPQRAVKLALCITTYRREAAAEAAMARLGARFGDDPGMRIIVVDNGRTLPCREAQDGRLRVLHNPNLGGSGGFARGLIEARAAGATHCLFMDDDVTLHTESIARARALLEHARDPATAVSGAMIDAARPWFLWENGATYQLFCHPLEMGRDLRDPAESRALAQISAEPVPEGFYGGWWFFAFPLDHVDHLPFPFFVRGDDVSFSLANRFAQTTLPGIASFQENFTDKESPLTWYLDLRSHLVHQLSLRGAGRLACAKIIGWFAMRCLVRMHYDSLAALSLAVEDVLEGPDHFAAQGDLADRRAQIAALTGQEAWTCPSPEQSPNRHWLSPHSWLVRTLMKFTLNGHLLPGFALFGNRITLDADQRGALRLFWGAAEIRQINRAGDRSYTVRHSKRRAWRESRRILSRLLRLMIHHEALSREWQSRYPELTGEAWWRTRLPLVRDR